MICTKCFEIIVPNVKNSVGFGYPDEGIVSISHALPCGDGLNDDDSKLIDADDLEGIIEAAKERVRHLEEVSQHLGDDLNLCMVLLIGKKDTGEFREFLAEKRGVMKKAKVSK